MTITENRPLADVAIVAPSSPTSTAPTSASPSSTRAARSASARPRSAAAPFGFVTGAVVAVDGGSTA